MMESDVNSAGSAVEIANERWNALHDNYERNEIRYDDWLETFREFIDRCDTPVIDLGCGSGNDTLYLLEKGKKVVPCDYSQNAVKNIYKNFPEIKRAECFDMTKGLVFEDHFTDIIISDLSLHYFTEQETHGILNEIKRVLKPGGVLIFRVNSVRDVNHGAGEGTEIEPHLYKTDDGRYKRFFAEEDFDKFFSGWKRLYLHEEVMERYALEKILWKAAMQAEDSVQEKLPS